MDRSLKLRTIGLIGLVLLCVCILLPTVTDEDSRPSWFPFKRKINLGLDLKGGLHIVYSIDLNTAIVDRASEIERDLRARFEDDKTKIEAVVRAPLSPLGAVVIEPKDPNQRQMIEGLIKTDYGDT